MNNTLFISACFRPMWSGRWLLHREDMNVFFIPLLLSWMGHRKHSANLEKSDEWVNLNKTIFLMLGSIVCFVWEVSKMRMLYKNLYAWVKKSWIILLETVWNNLFRPSKNTLAYDTSQTCSILQDFEICYAMLLSTRKSILLFLKTVKLVRQILPICHLS